MKSNVEYDEAHDQYALGAVIEGEFVSFLTVPGPQVRGAIESAKNAKEAAESKPQS